MNAETIASNSLYAHSGILVVAVGAYYKYGNRASIVLESSVNFDRVLGSTLNSIVERFERGMIDSQSVKHVNVGAGTIYIERNANGIGSERFKETLKRIILESSPDMLEFHAIHHWKTRIYIWSRRLSRFLICLISWQGLAASTQLFAQFSDYSIEPMILGGLLSISISLAAACLVCVHHVDGFRGSFAESESRTLSRPYE